MGEDEGERMVEDDRADAEDDGEEDDRTVGTPSGRIPPDADADALTRPQWLPSSFPLALCHLQKTPGFLATERTCASS